MKKSFVMILAALLVAGAMVGCSSGSSSSSSSSETSSSSSAPSSSSAATLPTIAELHTAVKDAYGEDYLPSTAYDEKAMAEVVGVNMDNVEEFVAEVPMISNHVDTFIAIKAKEGKADDVEKELNTYRDKLVSDTMNYPSNLAKIQASKVVRNGDYVFFMMLGAIDENMDASEADAAKFAEEQIKKGTDAIENLFK